MRKGEKNRNLKSNEAADAEDAAGQPAALYLTKYTVGELAGSEFTCALHEVEEALVETVERTAMPWKVTDENKKIIKDLRDNELKKPDGARSSTQLAAKAVHLKLFQKKNRDAIQRYISRAQLVSEENKDMVDCHTDDHLRQVGNSGCK